MFWNVRATPEVVDDVRLLAQDARRRVARATRHHDRALLRRVDAGERVEQRGLAGAVGTDHGEDLAALHLHRDVVEADDAAESQRDVLDVEDHVSAPISGLVIVAVMASHPLARGHRLRSTAGARSRPCSSALRRRAGIRPAGRKIIISRSSAPIHICRSGRHLVLEELRQPGEHGRTGHRAGQRAHATEHDVGDDEDRVVQDEVVRGEEADLAGEEHAGQTGGRGTDREGQQLDACWC